MRKNWRKWAARGIAVVLLTTMVSQISVPQFAANELEEAKKQKEEMEQKLKDTQAALNSLESKKDNTEQYIKEIDGYISSLGNNIYAIQQEIAAKQVEIDNKQIELDNKQEDINLQYESMKLRIQYMYENGNTQYLSMIFDNDGMSDMLNKAEYLSEITEYDRDMMEKLKTDFEVLTLEKQNLDAEKKILEGRKAELDAEQSAAQVLIDAKRNELSSTNNSILDKEEAIKRQKAEIAAQEAEIRELEELERKRKEEEAARLQALLQSGQVYTFYNGGQMAWPLDPSIHRITWTFGMHTDSYTGISSYHSGLDIGCPTGTPVYAAYDGQVAWVTYNQYSGNWVGIDHGNGVYTMYKHLSASLVSVGQVVYQGQQIALSGATGMATGPHLHFQVRVNGADVNPTGYVTIPN